jgi:threonine/homoserine/homoserine lactone efflux protein
MVARTSLAVSRTDGIAAAFGMGAGSVLFSIAALLGLQAVMNAVPSFYAVVKVLGGVYLLYLGYLIWRGANKPVSLSGMLRESNDRRTLRRSFLLGLATQISNPKTAVVYASIFASLLPREFPVSVIAGLPLLVFDRNRLVFHGCGGFVRSPPRATYLRSKSKIDRIAGGVMAVIESNSFLGRVRYRSGIGPGNPGVCFRSGYRPPCSIYARQSGFC